MYCIARQCVLPSLTQEQRERVIAEAALQSLAELLEVVPDPPLRLLPSESSYHPHLSQRRPAIIHRPCWRRECGLLHCTPHYGIIGRRSG